jgi:hypothetical protein
MNNVLHAGICCLNFMTLLKEQFCFLCYLVLTVIGCVFINCFCKFISLVLFAENEIAFVFTQ